VASVVDSIIGAAAADDDAPPAAGPADDAVADYPALLSAQLEATAQRLVSDHIQTSLDSYLAAVPAVAAGPPRLGQVVVANAPARVDLAGGWSDTPPICYEGPGAVLNVAVRVDGRCPVSCAARVVDRPVAVLRALRIANPAAPARDGATSPQGGSQQQLQQQPYHELYGALEFESPRDSVSSPNSPADKKSIVSAAAPGAPRYHGDVLECTSTAMFGDVADPTAPCALLKAVLLVLGVVDVDVDAAAAPTAPGGEAALATQLAAACGGPGRGIEVACCSALPAGSGMGGSSIVAAAALAAVAALLGRRLSREALVYLASQVQAPAENGTLPCPFFCASPSPTDRDVSCSRGTRWSK
jgi:hypothetical protein